MSVTSFFHTIVSSKLFMQIVIIEIIATLATGLLLGWFFGMLGTFAGGAFEWHTDAMQAGFIFGVVIIGPAINAVFLLFTRHFKGALIALLIAVAGFLVCFRLIPYLQHAKQAKLDAAPAEVIAQRAIDNVKSEKEYEDSVQFVYYVNLRLSLYECWSIRLDAAKTKEVVDSAAEIIAADESLAPRITKYGWRTVKLSDNSYHYIMAMYPEDGGYAELYSMKPEDWEQFGHAMPEFIEPDLESRK